MRCTYHILPAIFLSVFFLGCSKFSSKPIIRVTEPFEHMHFQAGTYFDVKANFSDNKGLASYHICASDASGNTHADFDIDDNGALSGKEYTYGASMQVPIDAEGTYYLHFIVVDGDGKSKELFHEFHIDQ